MEVSPDYARSEYRRKIDEHMQRSARQGRAAGLDYFFMNTGQPSRRGLARISWPCARGGCRWVSSRHGSWPDSPAWACRSTCTCFGNTRPRPMPFSSLMFFERRTQSSIKHRRLKYLLLFALRMAVWRCWRWPSRGRSCNRTWRRSAGGPKLTVLAIDNSFSMRAGRPAGARQARSRREWPRRLRRRDDKLQVLAFGSQVHVMGDSAAAIQTIQPVRHAQLLRRAFPRAALHRTIGAHAGGSAPVHGHAEVVHAGQFRRFAPGRQRAVDCASGGRSARVANFAVENVNAPRRVMAPAKRACRPPSPDTEPSRPSAASSLVLNGREMDSKSVDGAGRRPRHRGISAGGSALRTESRRSRIDTGDNLPDDDHFYFSVERAEARRVLFVHGAATSAKRSISGPPWKPPPNRPMRWTRFPWNRAPISIPRKYAFVVLSDVQSLPATFEACAAQLRARGRIGAGGAGPRVRACGKRVPVFDEPIVETRYSRAMAIVSKPPPGSTPGIRPFTTPHNWDDVKFYQAVRVNPGTARVAARLGDDTPLLLEKQIGEGRVLVFTSTFDNIANDFPLHRLLRAVHRAHRELSGAARRKVRAITRSARILELRQAQGTGRRGGGSRSQGRARADARRSHPRAQHAARHGGLLRCEAAQRPSRVGGRECGPPRIRPGRDLRRTRSRCGKIRVRGRVTQLSGGEAESAQQNRIVVVRPDRGAGSGRGRIVVREPALTAEGEPLKAKAAEAEFSAYGGYDESVKGLTDYLRRVERRLRVLAFTRGAAITAAAALIFTVLAVLLANAFAFSDPSVPAPVIALRGAGAGAGRGLDRPAAAAQPAQSRARDRTQVPCSLKSAC